MNNIILIVAREAMLLLACVNLTRMQSDGTDAGPMQYMLYVVLPVAIVAALAAMQMFIAMPTGGKPVVSEGNNQCAQLGAMFAGRGDVEGLRLLGDLAKYTVKGGGK